MINQTMGQVVPVPGTVAKDGRALYRADPAGDGETDIRVRRLGLDLTMIMAKPAIIVGVAPFSRVS